MARRILVTGSSSLVGSHFVESFGSKYELHAIGREDVFGKGGPLRSFDRIDITERGLMQEAVRRSGCEALVNFAAFTDVDACEKESGNTEGLVFRTNSLAVRWMAEACKAGGIAMYHISTDAVFDGTRGPYSEDDQPGRFDKKLGWYGFTKYSAEKELARVGPEHCLIRISYPYRARFDRKLDFARRILSLYREGKLYPLFDDQLLTPTLIDDVSTALDLMIERSLRGTYHVASTVTTTPFEFGSKLLSVFFPSDGKVLGLKRGSVKDFNRSPGHAPRPMKGGLLTKRIESAGFRPKTFEEGILEIHRQAKAGV